MVEHQINALYNIGVRTVVLAIGYKPEAMGSFVEVVTQKYPDLQIKISLEEVPLNTAGPIKLAEKHLLEGSSFNFGISFLFLII
jgi:mannose-1-phosphate guanylyltransferase